LNNQPVQIIINILCAIGAALPFAAIWFFSKGKWMGFGDVKFIALMGLMLGWPNIAMALFTAFMLGAFVGIILIASGRKNMSSKLPFGTFLSVATLISLFFGLTLWNAYWRLFGG
jgi:leader peptidase (prepilin peptidase)/N-methyltransferase